MKVTDTHIYFYSTKEIYSNFYLTEFVDPATKIKFNSSEQAFMWYKAKQFDDIESMKLLETETDPAKAKLIGRSVKNYNDNVWVMERFQKMMYVCYLKFDQNEYLKNAIIDTHDKILVEASKSDCVWGVGLYQTDPLILDCKYWRGSNLLGNALMLVRKQLVDNRAVEISKIII